MWAKIIAWVGSLAVGAFTGWRALFLVTFLAYLATTIYNFLWDLLNELYTFILAESDAITSGVGNLGLGVQQFTGIMGYFLDHLRVMQALSFVITCIIAKWTLRMISGLVPGVNV